MDLKRLQCWLYTQFSPTDNLLLTQRWYHNINGEQLTTEKLSISGNALQMFEMQLLISLKNLSAAGMYSCVFSVYLPELNIGKHSSAETDVFIKG